MTTFNPEEGKYETKETEVIETRQRSYSQEAKKEEFETKTVISHAFPLSQMVHPLSMFNDETESEQDEDEDNEDVAHRNKIKQAIATVKPTLSLFQRYLQWF